MNNQTIYLIGGTTEANRAARRLQEEGYRVIVSVATPLGAEVAAAAGLKTDTGRKDSGGMAASAVSLEAAAIVDCSHPFAREASEQARLAAGIAGLPYFRSSRPLWRQTGSTAADSPLVTVDSFAEAAGWLQASASRSLLTLGTRNLEPFVQAQLDFTARILPLSESLEDCRRLGIKPQDIIAAWPPFSVDFNRACLRQGGASTLVTKDSGREGGLEEKLQAAGLEGATVILVRRPGEPDAIHDLEVLVDRLKTSLAAERPRNASTAVDSAGCIESAADKAVPGA